MARLFLGKLTLSFCALLLLLCYSCAPTDQPTADAAAKQKVQKAQPQAKPAADKQKAQPQPEPPAEQPKIVAEISDYVITADELARNTMFAAVPDELDEEETYTPKLNPLGAGAMLMEMISDKAMIMRAREQNVLKDEPVTLGLLEDYREELTLNLFLDNYLEGKINITESEINAKMQSDSRLKKPEHARFVLKREKTIELTNELYEELYEELNVHEVTRNIKQAALIYKRLLVNSRRFGGQNFVRVKQITENLTQDEQNLPLIKFEGGSVTFKYWLNKVTDISPPSRPKDLDTPPGVSRFLQRILKRPILYAEAKKQGFHKDEGIVKLIRDREDMYLLYQAKRLKIMHISPESTRQEVIDYFNAHLDRYGESDRLTIKQIWCKDLETAWKARLELDNGADFDSVRQKYSFNKSDAAFDVYPGGQGMFFADLWKAEANEIVGPVKGFYGGTVKWRLVKILEKVKGRHLEYEDRFKRHIENDIYAEKKEQVISRYRIELLKRYPHKIYRENIIDPFDIP